MLEPIASKLFPLRVCHRHVDYLSIDIGGSGVAIIPTHLSQII